MPGGLAFALWSAAFTAAVFLKGGVAAQQWQWCAFAISAAAVALLPSRAPLDRVDRAGFTALGLLLGWMALQLVPLPPALVAWISPERWSTAAAARTATGDSLRAWLPLSVAPPATFERFLDVVPAIAGFGAARELAWRWRRRVWIVAAPVVVVAWTESLLGLAQFYLTGPSQIAGTYVNRDHFAGLLEMAFPLAAMGAIAARRKGVHAVLPLIITASLLAGIVLSLSRMAFLATLIAAGLSAAGVARFSGIRTRWRWAIPVAIPLAILLLLPTRDLGGRLIALAAPHETGRATRTGIWSDSLRLAAAYRWAGCGLGAFEQAMYRYQTVMPANTVDFAHDDALQIAAELGIGGAALAAAAGLWILWRLLAAVRSAHAHRELAIGLLAAILAIGLHSLADFNLYIPANALALAWLAGIAVSPALRSDPA